MCTGGWRSRKRPGSGVREWQATTTVARHYEFVINRLNKKWVIACQRKLQKLSPRSPKFNLKSRSLPNSKPRPNKNPLPRLSLKCRRPPSQSLLRRSSQSLPQWSKLHSQSPPKRSSHRSKRLQQKKPRQKRSKVSLKIFLSWSRKPMPLAELI